MQLEEVMSLSTIEISSAEKPSSPNQENLSQKQLDASKNVDEEVLKVTNIFGFEKVVDGASEWPNICSEVGTWAAKDLERCVIRLV
jgi:hypothetical protein